MAVPSRPFGPDRVPVAAVGIGTWNLEKDPRAEAVAAIRRAVEIGSTHVDTAEMYGNGLAEEIVGEALQGMRDRAFVATKVLPSNASYKGTIEACERSLRRLRMDRVDLYLLHWPGSHPIAETVRAFETLKAQGKIARWGVSNFDPDELEQAEKAAGKGKIACNQVLYNLQERTIEHAVVPWCEARGIAVVAYTPIGGERGFPTSAPLEALAQKKGLTPRQLALAFLLRRPGVFAIPKTGKAARAEENAKAASVELCAKEVEEIDRAFPAGPWRGLATL
jgi:diketogulonate reductase-like aldo/keto reductase